MSLMIQHEQSIIRQNKSKIREICDGQGSPKIKSQKCWICDIREICVPRKFVRVWYIARWWTHTHPRMHACTHSTPAGHYVQFNFDIRSHIQYGIIHSKEKFILIPSIVGLYSVKNTLNYNSTWQITHMYIPYSTKFWRGKNFGEFKKDFGEENFGEYLKYSISKRKTLANHPSFSMLKWNTRDSLTHNRSF